MLTRMEREGISQFAVFARGSGKTLLSACRTYLRCVIEDAPTIDPEDLRSKGRWIVIDDDYGWDEETDDEFYYVLECECSECHERVRADCPNYCPHCGCRMDGGNE